MRKERIIYNNYDLYDMFDDCQVSLAEFYEPDEINDEMIWDRVYLEDGLNWHDEHASLKEFFDGSGPWLLRGHVGLWNGQHAAGYVFADFDEMFYKAAQDCEYWKIWDENGHLYLKCSHHDGTNIFEIKRLTQKACAFLEKWKYNSNDTRSTEEIHDIIWNNNFFSGLPHYALNVYGCKKQEALTV